MGVNARWRIPAVFDSSEPWQDDGDPERHNQKFQPPRDQKSFESFAHSGIYERIFSQGF
jgi:hypothetical protein